MYTPGFESSGEKFFALCRDFGSELVGMATGDVSINPQARHLHRLRPSSTINHQSQVRKRGRLSAMDVYDGNVYIAYIRTYILYIALCSLYVTAQALIVCCTAEVLANVALRDGAEAPLQRPRGNELVGSRGKTHEIERRHTFCGVAHACA